MNWLLAIDLCIGDTAAMDLAVLRARGAMQLREHLDSVLTSIFVDLVNIGLICGRLD